MTKTTRPPDGSSTRAPEPPHHCAPSDYDAMICALRDIEAGVVSSRDVDWRTTAGVLARMLTYATRRSDAGVDARAERVFQAVVYAFEGREVPEDLRDHGMVRRALKYAAAQQEQRDRLIAERDEIVEQYKRAVEWHRDMATRLRAVVAADQGQEP